MAFSKLSSGYVTRIYDLFLRTHVKGDIKASKTFFTYFLLASTDHNKVDYEVDKYVGTLAQHLLSMAKKGGSKVLILSVTNLEPSPQTWVF